MNKKFIIYIVIAFVLLVGLFILVRPKQPTPPTSNQPEQTNNTSPNKETLPPTPTVKTFELVIKNKKITSGPETLQVNEGDDVSITVTSDIEEEFHLHGYDNSVELEKDKPAILSFKATLSGRFAFELEKSKTDIGVIEVLPK